MEILEEDYFKATVFKKLAHILWRRWYRQGSFGQTLGLSTLKTVDLAPLWGLLGVPSYEQAQKKSISVSLLDEALRCSRFRSTLEKLVETLEGKQLTTKKEVEEKEAAQYRAFVADLQRMAPVVAKHLTENECRQWCQWFKQQDDTVRWQPFLLVENAWKNIPTTITRIPFYAYTLCGNPHALDGQEVAGRLLRQTLYNAYEMVDTVSTDDEMAHLTGEQENIQEMTPTEKENNLLLRFNLVKDDTLNFVAIQGLIATNGAGDEHPLWQAAVDTKTAWQVSLKQILEMATIQPARGKAVVLVENAGLYSMLSDVYPTLPLVCTAGQFTYAVWMLLRKLVASGCTLYYSGDMDVMGLVMAQRLRDRFPKAVRYLAMNTEVYIAHALPRNDVYDEMTVKRLQCIKDCTLQPIADAIMKSGKVVYQEGIIESIIHEIKSALVCDGWKSIDKACVL